MNKYDELYIFRQATIKDLDRLMLFIRENWRKGHILGEDEEFFKYEHVDGNNINFILCEEKDTQVIIGMHGFIPYSNSRSKHVCGVMTLVKKDAKLPMLGVELIKRFINITKYDTYCGIGTNPKTMVPLVKNVFKRHVGKMQHYYKLNRTVTEFKIANIKNKETNEYTKNKNITIEQVQDFRELKEFDFGQLFENLPYKSEEYIHKRYFKHPIYVYKIFKVYENSSLIAFFIGREISINKTKILRLIDYVGNIKDIAKLGESLDQLTTCNSYEYIDCLAAHIPTGIMKDAGFVLKNETDINIIPTYFEPFVQQNIDIWYETSHKDLVVFKGDADADRPNYR